MRRNKRKFCFIICVHDEYVYEECLLYINRLNIPSGFTTEVLPIYKAKGMAEGYNKGMTGTDAKYKVYMHQNVFITNPNFLNDVLTVFKQNWKIGMIGVLGAPVMPPSGVMWHGNRVGNLDMLNRDIVDYSGYEYKKEDGMTEVEAIEGLIMVTKEDVLWREDIFDGWDFYDVSQSYEFRKKGYHVVVPKQKKPWCAQGDGIRNLWGYDKYRKLFLKEYMQESAEH